MKRIPIHASIDYEVLIDRGSLHYIGAHLLNIHKPCQIIIVTDDNVGPLYAQIVRDSLVSAGYTVHTYTLPHGEHTKSTTELIKLVEHMAKLGLTRKDVAIALGGGVIGDLTGFAAATYLRGIDYVQIPTSLLAAVDSSVGGKTAVNLEAGKNLWGAFKQPLLVLCDPDTLSTLPEEEWKNGCGEIIKYGFLDMPELLDTLTATPLMSHRHIVDDIIAQCVAKKAHIVELDEREGGLRALLNFGHTFAHGIESSTNFAIPHGQAVAIGMMLITKGATRHDNLPISVLNQLEDLLKAHQLPTTTPIAKETLIEAAKHDKKSQGQTITIIVPTRYGHSERKVVTFTELADYLD